MSIKYGELTIIYKKQITIGPFLTWLNVEYPNKEDQYIFLFDDGEICELNDKKIDFNFEFFRLNNDLPRYFKKPKTTPFYFRYFIKNNPNLDKLFNTYSKNDLCIHSIYNGIYFSFKHTLKPEVFGIKRIKSSDTMPRYQFAYDTDDFTKEETMYILHSILKKN
jgi:hypothetical protein